MIRSGRLRALAVSSVRRDVQLRDVPTFPEAGLKAFELMTWVAAFVPAGTPRPIVEQLNGMFRTALAQPRVQESMSPMGVSVAYSPSAEMRAYVSSELLKWKHAVVGAGIDPE